MAYKKVNILLILIISFFSVSNVTSKEVLKLDTHNLDDLALSCTTSVHWSFHPGDNSTWGMPHFDDSNWITRKTIVTPKEYKTDNDLKHGWYRLQLEIDSSLWDKSIGLGFGLIGAVEIYLNGNLIHSIGTVGSSVEDEIALYATDFNRPLLLNFDRKRDQVLAVKFSGFNKDLIQNNIVAIGFILKADIYEESLSNFNKVYEDSIKNQMFFVGLTFAFGLLHLLMFLFYKRVRENLYFALFTFSCTLLSYAPYKMIVTQDLNLQLNILFLFKLSLISVSITSIKVLYTIFYDKQPSYFKYILVLAGVALFFHNYFTIQKLYIVVIIFFIEVFRIIAISIYQKRKYASIIGVGFTLFLMFSAYQMLVEIIGLPGVQSPLQPYLVGIMGLIVSISLYIALSISSTSINLEKKLAEVEELSKRTIQQEVASKLLQKDIEHKDKLLEESKRLEQAMHDLENTHMKLQHAEEHMRIIIDASPVPLIVTRVEDGVILYANKHLGRLVGYSVDDLQGRKSPDFYTNPHARKQVVEKLKKDGILDNYEVQIKRYDGYNLWCLFSLVATKLDGEDVIIGGLYDISERKEAEEKLKAANKEIKLKQSQLIQSEKMASLGQLVAGVAHEINNPMGAIMSIHKTQMKATERLKEQLKILCKLKESDQNIIDKYVSIIDNANEVISSGSSRVSEIVRRLKSFARLDEAELQEIDVNECIEETLNLIHHEIKNDIIVNKSCPDVPKIACYPGQLNQVLLNLLINAKHALENNKEKGQIHISTIYHENRVMITIEDNGKGIPKENLSKIFDPGFTTKGVGVGTGLGLSICYQIIKEHRGEIRVESKVGYGTIFVVDLPTNLVEILEKEEENNNHNT